MENENDGENALEIFNPIKELVINGKKIEVKELSWVDGMQFLEQFAKHAGKFITTDGRFVLTQDNAVEIITGTKSLADGLIKKSAGMEPDGLSFGDALEVLEAALSMNVRPDFFAKVKRITARLGSVMGIKQKPKNKEKDSPASSHISSTTDTKDKT